jgi:hypothetical protein
MFQGQILRQLYDDERFKDGAPKAAVATPPDSRSVAVPRQHLGEPRVALLHPGRDLAHLATPRRPRLMRFYDERATGDSQ